MTKTQHLLFVRHGETVGNLEKIAHGQTESPLNDRGIQQAQSTASMLTGWQTPYHRVYASPLARAHETGTYIAEKLGLDLCNHDGLMEGSLGDWEEVTYAELDALGFAKKSILDDDFRGHNGESPNQLGSRMARVVDEIKANHTHENIIFVSHGAAIAHLVARLLDTRPAFGYQYLMHNAAVTELAVQIDTDVHELKTLNYYEHLPHELRADPLRRDQTIE